MKYKSKYVWIVVVAQLPVAGMALFPFVLVKKANPSAALIHHELIHFRQQAELLILPFYVWYLLSYLWNRLKGYSHYRAYKNIIFEREAYQEDENLAYLQKRPFWAFLKY
ncbi:hypothetical protein [Flectobacillus major]|uniref:hypothetical protein n=1 Tax=Flectobacillus major TaxID=103 RepID=UPI0005C46288|nr:hypothetical protein [Flectobacillus major]